MHFGSLAIQVLLCNEILFERQISGYRISHLIWHIFPLKTSFKITPRLHTRWQIGTYEVYQIRKNILLITGNVL